VPRGTYTGHSRRNATVDRCCVHFAELMAAKQGPNVLFCIPNRTKRILLVLVDMVSKRALPSQQAGGLSPQSEALAG
jgi:hypothetical protein